jgi:GNAT superfamily N-acetyltransferase
VSPQPITIRLYADGDADAVVRLSLRAWAPVFDSIERAMDADVYRSFYPDWKVQQRQAVEAALADPGHHVWVAEGESGAVGFVSIVLHRDSRTGEIHMIAVDPDHQRTGVRAALTGFAIDWMREAGMAVAMVETGNDPGHTAARRTYERAGFRAFPVTRFFKKL